MNHQQHFIDVVNAQNNGMINSITLITLITLIPLVYQLIRRVKSL